MNAHKNLAAETHGIFYPIWTASCAIIDLNVCATAIEPRSYAPSDLHGKTPLAALRADGWVKTKEHGWLCAPCHRAYRTGRLTVLEEYDD